MRLSWIPQLRTTCTARAWHPGVGAGATRKFKPYVDDHIGKNWIERSTEYMHCHRRRNVLRAGGSGGGGILVEPEAKFSHRHSRFLASVNFCIQICMCFHCFVCNKSKGKRDGQVYGIDLVLNMLFYANCLTNSGGRKYPLPRLGGRRTPWPSCSNAIAKSI
jgi:hypothetical protein